MGVSFARIQKKKLIYDLDDSVQELNLMSLIGLFQHGISCDSMFSAPFLTNKRAVSTPQISQVCSESFYSRIEQNQHSSLTNLANSSVYMFM